jgi:threonine/homoserine/homoserine lactone efflux protein
VGKGAQATCPPFITDLIAQWWARFALPTYEDYQMTGTNFILFLLAALVIAVVPGPGIFYVAARTLSGGKRAGFASTFGTALGGLVHVVGGALGVSALILASAELFTVLKFAGALYLVWLGIKTFREARELLPQQTIVADTQRVFREGVLVEALNPKTAAFFLAFIPQFVDPANGYVALQFITLGLISVALNTLVDVAVVMMAATARNGLTRKPNVIQRLRQGSGLFIAGLGVSLALARRPAS